jgi:hypothetical protein
LEKKIHMTRRKSKGGLYGKTFHCGSFFLLKIFNSPFRILMVNNNIAHLSGKDDISQHEKTLANLLHQEIFETGRYFKETSESACFQHRAKEKDFLLHQEVTVLINL